MLGLGLVSVPTVAIGRSQVGPAHVPVGLPPARRPEETRSSLSVAGPTSVFASLVDEESITPACSLCEKVEFTFLSSLVLFPTKPKTLTFINVRLIASFSRTSRSSGDVIGSTLRTTVANTWTSITLKS